MRQAFQPARTAASFPWAYHVPGPLLTCKGLLLQSSPPAQKEAKYSSPVEKPDSPRSQVTSQAGKDVKGLCDFQAWAESGRDSQGRSTSCSRNHCKSAGCGAQGRGSTRQSLRGFKGSNLCFVLGLAGRCSSAQAVVMAWKCLSSDRCLHLCVYKVVHTDTQNSEELLSAIQEPGTEPAQKGHYCKPAPRQRGTPSIKTRFYTCSMMSGCTKWYKGRLKYGKGRGSGPPKACQRRCR